MKKSLSVTLELIGVVILIIFDRLTKAWASNSLVNTEGIDLIPGVLKFYYLPHGNTGAAFGMFKGQLWLFILITVIVVAALVYMMIRIPNKPRYAILHIIFVLIVAGGIGNMIDRVAYHSVVDFIYFYLINFPIFNVADCFVTVATILLAILILFYYKEEDFKLIEEAIKPGFLKKGNNEGDS